MSRRPTAAPWPALAALALLLALPIAPGVANAAEPEHDGVLLRLALGTDYSSAVSDDDASSYLRGGAGMLSLDLGLTLFDRLAIHARGSARKLWNPKVKIAGSNLGALDDTSLSSIMLAPALSFYGAGNWYLTGAVGPARAQVRVAGEPTRSLIGYGFETDLGHEWGTGGDFAIGVGARLSYYSVPQVDGHVSWLGMGFIVSATSH
jgi:hypothetical protein